MKARTGDSWGQVETPHYDGPSYKGIARTLADRSFDPEKSCSNSELIFPHSFGFLYPNGKTWATNGAYRNDRYPVSINGKLHLVLNTGRNLGAEPLAEHLKYGASTWDDITVYRDFEGWKGSTERLNFAIDAQKSYGKRTQQPFRYLVMGSQEEISNPKLNLYSTPISYQGPPIDLGKYVSIAANLKQSQREFLGSRSGEVIRDDYHTRAFDGIGVMSGNDLFGVLHLGNGQKILYTGTDSYRRLHAWGKEHGASLEAMVSRALFEENLHAREGFKPSRSLKARVQEEIDVRYMMIGELTKQLGDARLSERERADIRATLRQLNDDLKNVNRYYAVYAKERYALEGKLRAEAEEYGLKGEAAQKYVSARMQEYNGKKTSEKSTKYASKRDDQGRSKEDKGTKTKSQDAEAEDASEQAEQESEADQDNGSAEAANDQANNSN